MIWSTTNYPQQDVSAMIPTLYGGILGICCLIIIGLHSLYRYYNTKLSKNIKLIIYMEWAMIFFNIMADVSISFVRNNYFNPSITQYTRAICVYGYLSQWLGIVIARFISYILYIYRVYITFSDSVYELSIKVACTLIFIEFLSILFFLIAIPVEMILNYGYDAWPLYRVNYNGHQFIYYGKKIHNDYSWYFPAVAFYALVEFILSIYILYIFVSRLYFLYRRLVLQNVSQNIISLDTIGTHSVSASNQASGTDIANMSVSMNTNAHAETISDLTRITLKQTILTSISIITILILTICTAVYESNAGAYIVYVGVINVLSLHLMHSFCNPIWNMIACCGCLKK
eukprot:302440_1